jgi:6-phosphogluconolactonase
VRRRRHRPDLDRCGEPARTASAAIAELHTGDRRDLLLAVARDFTTEWVRAVARRGFCSIAIPGGSVATTCFPALAALPLDWRQLRCFWVDERAVAPLDPESNYALAHNLWLAPAAIPPSSIHRMPADNPDLDAAAAAYSDVLTSVIGPPAILDFVLLGVGPDGHVASLFPNHPALDCANARVAAIVDAPKPPPRRLTLTMPVLTAAERVVVVAFGAEKAEALREALDRPDSPQPLATVLRRSKRALVLADREAASLVKA